MARNGTQIGGLSIDSGFDEYGLLCIEDGRDGMVLLRPEEVEALRDVLAARLSEYRSEDA